MTNKHKKIELLAPAGSMECLKTALYFGADAVYLAGKRFGLRAFADNFSLLELSEAAALAHSHGARIYLTLNSLVHDEELPEATDYARDALIAGVDAFIISDPGLIAPLRALGAELHLSTQASTMNSSSVRFWSQCGISRIVLARELPLENIRAIYAATQGTPELEAFIHGAMCVAYSGRCLLSSVMTGRSGNRGECAQPCRFQYQLYEKDAGVFPIQEDEHGTYVLNSRDLMMIEHIPELIESGICSFKVEGRMKGMHYVGSVINAYRRAIDACLADPEGYRTDPALVRELELSATRRFTTGFFFGNPGADGQDTLREPPKQRLFFCGIVRSERDKDGMLTIEQRGKFCVGDELFVLSPTAQGSFCADAIFSAETGEPQESAPHPQQLLRIPCPMDLHPGDMLRKMI